MGNSPSDVAKAALTGTPLALPKGSFCADVRRCNHTGHIPYVLEYSGMFLLACFTSMKSQISPVADVSCTNVHEL